jgi:stage V sporulation protein G
LIVAARFVFPASCFTGKAQPTAKIQPANHKSEVSMQLTEIRVFPVDEDKLKAYVTITFDHCFVIRDVKIITGTSGYFVSMPSKKRKDGTYKDIAHPINQETRAMIEERIIGEYQKTLADTAAKRASSTNEPSLSAQRSH